LKWLRVMSRVLLLTSHPEDGRALLELLAEDGQEVELVNRGGWTWNEIARDARQADVIVAEAEPWTWAGRALLEGWGRQGSPPRLILLSCRPVARPPSPAIRCLRKPIDVDALRRAIGAPAPPRRREEAA
jgi:hypothetical protein